MNLYYTSIILLCCLSLAILCQLVSRDHRIPAEDKRLYYITYLIIALAALSEWAGVLLRGHTELPAVLLRMAKCLDYTLTPLSGGALAAQMKLRNRWRLGLIAVLAVNTVLQIVSLFTGWVTVIDAQHVYHDGPLYGVYVAIYLSIMGLVAMQFRLYGRSFPEQNRFSLYAILTLIFLGVLVQETLDGEARTVYLTLTIGAALLFIHTMEFSQQAADAHIQAQHILISTDALTGLYSRHAYSQALKEHQQLCADCVAFSVDINGLKNVNDTLGHEAGDELICGAARCLDTVFSGQGQCYRTGGDEFIVLAHMSPHQSQNAMERLARLAERWRGKAVDRLSLSAGCALAADHPGVTCEELVREADLAMFRAKAAYYQSNGNDRRGKSQLSQEFSAKH